MWCKAGVEKQKRRVTHPLQKPQRVGHPDLARSCTPATHPPEKLEMVLVLLGEEGGADGLQFFFLGFFDVGEGEIELV